ncbi:MAG: hypothetical protein ACE149_15450 [Armatimonadota bacterium]
MEGRNALGTARLIATLMYVGPLVAFPWIGRFVKVGEPLGPNSLPVLGAVLLVVGIVDYGLSLFLEAKLLGQASERGPQGVVAAAVVTAAFGASLAVYGLVLTILGAAVWGSVLYVLCAVHGLHLMVRWPSYAAAAERTDSSV